MPEKPSLNHPWLIAVWPGMGHVALNAGYYLLAKLDSQLKKLADRDFLAGVGEVGASLKIVAGMHLYEQGLYRTVSAIGNVGRYFSLLVENLDASPDRLLRLLAAVCSGYADALRKRTLDQPQPPEEEEDAHAYLWNRKGALSHGTRPGTCIAFGEKSPPVGNSSLRGPVYLNM